MIDNKNFRDLIEYSSYLEIFENELESPIFSPSTVTEFSLEDKGGSIPLKTRNDKEMMGMGFTSTENVEEKLATSINAKVDGTKKQIGALTGDGPQKVSTQPDNVWLEMINRINEQYKKETSTYKYMGRQENIAADWNKMAQEVNKDPNNFFNTAKTEFSKVAQDVQTYRANQEYQDPEDQQDASKTFMSILTNDMMQFSRGPDESNMAAASLEGTSMGQMLSGGGEEQQQLSWSVFEDFLIYTDKYAELMKQANPNFETSILFDMRDRYLEQGIMTKGKDWGQQVSEKRDAFLIEQKRIQDMINENNAKDISMDVLSGLSSQFGSLSQKTSEISSQILNMENISKQNKEWEWSVQKSGEDVNEDTMGFVIEEDNTSRPTRKTSEAIKFAFDEEYFNQKAIESETPISLLAMQSEKAKQELIKAISPEMLRGLIEQETSQGKSNREQREKSENRKQEEYFQQILRTMGVSQEELTIPASEVNKNIMQDISQDFKNWSSGIETFANYQQEDNVDETEAGYVINQQEKTRRFTQQQELLNRLIIDQNSRNLYAQANNIDPNAMNEWAKNRFEQEKQKYGPTYEMDVLSYAQSIVDPKEFNKSSFLNYDYSKGISFENINQYFATRPTQVYQQKEIQFENMKRNMDNRRKQASMNVWAAAMENMPEDVSKRDEFIADATNKFEVQVEEDSRLLFGLRAKENEQKILDSQRIKNEENSKLFEIGQDIENNLLNKQQKQIFNKGANVAVQETPTAPEEMEQDKDPIYQSAIKSLEDTGINAGLMLQRNVKEQNEALGEVNEAEVGFVRTRDGGIRPTEAQLLREQMIINPENFKLTQAAQDGVRQSIKSAKNTEKIIMNKQRNIQKQQAMMQTYNNQNIPETPEDFNIQQEIEESIRSEIEERVLPQRSYWDARGLAQGGFKFFRRKGASKFKTVKGEEAEEIEEDIEDEMEEEPPVEQEPIKEEKKIEAISVRKMPEIIKQQDLAPMIQREEPKEQISNERMYQQEIETKDIIKEEINKDQIMTSSGQVISGPTANQIIKEKEKTDSKEEFLSYIEEKIKENNTGLSNNFKNDMNNIANNVSIDNLNKACEGL